MRIYENLREFIVSNFVIAGAFRSAIYYLLLVATTSSRILYITLKAAATCSLLYSSLHNYATPIRTMASSYTVSFGAASQLYVHHSMWFALSLFAITRL